MGRIIFGLGSRASALESDSRPDGLAVAGCHGDKFHKVTAALPLGSRRNEDIALDLMKFIAMTTGYGKTIGSGVGFQSGGAAAKAEDYAAHLLGLYGRCLLSVSGK